MSFLSRKTYFCEFGRLFSSFGFGTQTVWSDQYWHGFLQKVSYTFFRVYSRFIRAFCHLSVLFEHLPLCYHLDTDRINYTWATFARLSFQLDHAEQTCWLLCAPESVNYSANGSIVSVLVIWFNAEPLVYEMKFLIIIEVRTTHIGPGIRT